jgi:hypothetical protein
MFVLSTDLFYLNSIYWTGCWLPQYGGPFNTLLKITPIFKSFNDFKRFSLHEENECGSYPDLITHEMEYQKKEDTLKWIIDIKKALKNYDAVLQKNHGK